MEERFVHLHNHTEYSFGRGMLGIGNRVGEPLEFLGTVVREGMSAVAITDRDNLHGAIEFYQACRKAGIKPIIGCEMSVAKDACLTVLARDFQGYQNLLALSTKASLESGATRQINKKLLAEHAKGLIVLSGGLEGPLSQIVLSGDMDGACRLAEAYRDTLDEGCFFIELMDHGTEEEKQALKGLLEVHKRTGIPLVATNDNRYLHKDDAGAHDALLCIHAGKRISDNNRPRMSGPEFYFKTPEEMAKLFGFAPESLSNTVRIAQMCSLEIPLDKLHVPAFPVPEGFTQDSYLAILCRRGLGRFGLLGNEEYSRRLDAELGIINKMGVSGFFLIIWDFVRYAKENGIPVGPGRGSNAGPLVCYALNITAVDPLRYKLLFERFLSPDRRSMPNIDIDFSDQGRGKIIEYVQEKYGQANVAQIVTFGSLKARLVIRDVGRVMGVPLCEVDRVAKLVPPGNTIDEAMGSVPDLRTVAAEPEIHQLLDLARKLEGLKRHTAVHAAGIVITKDSVWKYAPLTQSASGVVMTQYDASILPMLGLAKLDFLGLRHLARIAKAVELVRARHDHGFDLAHIPMDDSKTFELLAAGETDGVFQFDSVGFRDFLRRIRPTTFEDISAALALYRPGPMASGLLDLFIERKHGKPVRYDHPALEPILRDTYGCILYQEQVMEIAKSLASFTPGEADSLRKTVGKKIPEEIEKQRSRFVNGAAKNGVDPANAARIFDKVEKFGGYSFNKSHTVAYGMIAYQMAYLKANYASEFAAAQGSDDQFKVE